MSEEDGPEGGMRIDTDLIRQLAQMLSENELSEIEVEDGDRRIVVKRKLAAAAPVYVPSPHPASSSASAAPPHAAAAPTVIEESAANHPGAVKSPMVGTVFLAAEPGGAAFVSAGSRVEEGDTLLIIEAMKVMNPIAAPRAGLVKQVLVQDSQPVEYDQPLVIIE